MPEFQLDHGSPEASQQFAQLDEFTQGYVTALFFTDASSADDGELADATLAELAPDAWKEIKEACADFQQANADDLTEACDNGRINGYDMERAGTDFWFTRNGHGAGYWDRGLGEVGETLSKAARVYGSVYLYRGDDKLIYIG